MSADQKAVMEETYSFHRHIYDFTRKFYLFGRDLLILLGGLAVERRLGVVLPSN